MTLAEYKAEIKKETTTEEELRQITYKAFLQDKNALKGRQSLYEKIITMCINREVELGLA